MICLPINYSSLGFFFFFFFSSIHFELCHVNIVTTEEQKEILDGPRITELYHDFLREYFFGFFFLSPSNLEAFFCDLLLKLKIKLFGISIWFSINRVEYCLIFIYSFFIAIVFVLEIKIKKMKDSFRFIILISLWTIELILIINVYNFYFYAILSIFYRYSFYHVIMLNIFFFFIHCTLYIPDWEFINKNKNNNVFYEIISILTFFSYL